MEKRTVRQGQHDYSGKRHRFDAFARDVRSVEVRFRIPREAWFDPTEDGPIQRDGKDWNKVGGISYVKPLKWRTWFKNSCAAMIAWRPAETAARFEVCLYVNREDRTWDTSPAVEIAAGVDVEAVVLVQGVSVVSASLAGAFAWTDVNPYSIRGVSAMEVGTWFGGNRPAPHQHSLYVDTSW